jgi:hypothetical protein
MESFMVICSVKGVVDIQELNGRTITAMCSAIKCSGNECSLKFGECEYQFPMVKEDTTIYAEPVYHENCPMCGKSCEIRDFAPVLIYCDVCKKYSEF